jgi:pimeloyl-ACP methyl ester carboxylesterase
VPQYSTQLTPKTFLKNGFTLMKKYYIYVLIIFTLASASYHRNTSMPTSTQLTHTNNTSSTLSDTDLLYFDTQNFLGDSDKVVKTLMVDGFKECTFTTPDKYTIHGLYLERPNAPCTIICCAGFYPGKKEGIASIVKMAPHCNILLFDSRGHGKSDGTLVVSTVMGQYARYEYQDIIGAIQFCTNLSPQTPIYLWGICAGAVHMAHALIQLTKQVHKYPICGFTFDSGWASLTKISKTVPCAGAQKRIVELFGQLYNTDDAHTIHNGMMFNYVADTTDACIKLLHTTIVQWPFRWHEAETNLFNKISAITVPTLFIHSYDDTYAPIKDVQKLAASVKNSTTWWIVEPSRHACHHLKHKDEYISRLNTHINESIIAYKNKK